MARVEFVIPGDINLPTGGYAYDRRLLSLLPELGVDIRRLELPGSFPAPAAADLAETRRRVAATARDSILMIDGLAYGAMPADLIRGFGRRIVALVHHPLCMEAGLTAQRAAELRRLETEALTLAERVVASSHFTARTLAAEFGVPASKITPAEPGTEPAARARGTWVKGGEAPLHVLAVGSIVPRKGYDVLIEALAPLKSLRWRLDIAGATDRSPETTAALERQIAAAGLADRVSLLGPVDDPRLAELYDHADVFVLSSHYEGYGMVLTEALSRGLAIVSTTGGAAAETIPDDAALKVEPRSPRAMMWAVGRAIEDAGIRKRISDAAWAAAAGLPRWSDTAARVASVLKEMSR